MIRQAGQVVYGQVQHRASSELGICGFWLMTLSCPAAALPMQAKAAQNLSGKPAASASPGDSLEEGLWAGLTAQQSFHHVQRQHFRPDVAVLTGLVGNNYLGRPSGARGWLETN